MTIRDCGPYDERAVTALYAAVGWTNYTKNPAMLKEAFAHSLCALGAYEDDKLVGLVRAVGDGASIVFIQDVLVLPEYQRRGIGTALVKTVMARYAGVYQLQLLTDSTPRTKAFYRSLGFSDAADMGCSAFIIMATE